MPPKSRRTSLCTAAMHHARSPEAATQHASMPTARESLGWVVLHEIPCTHTHSTAHCCKEMTASLNLCRYVDGAPPPQQPHEASISSSLPIHLSTHVCQNLHKRGQRVRPDPQGWEKQREALRVPHSLTHMCPMEPSETTSSSQSRPPAVPPATE